MHHANNWRNSSASIFTYILFGILPQFVMLKTARADIFDISLQREVGFQQSSDASVAVQFAQFFTQVDAVGYDSGVLSFPGSLTLYLSPHLNIPPFGEPYIDGFYGGSGAFASQAELDAAYPSGTYEFSLTDSYSGVTDVASVDTTLVDTALNYPQSVPYLAGSDYSRLQGMDASKSFTFHFAGIDPTANSQFVVYDINSGRYDIFMGGIHGELFAPGGTFEPAHTFAFELLSVKYTNFAATGTYNPEAVIDSFYYTRGFFHTAAVPEPSSVALLATAFVTLGIFGLQRKYTHV